MRQRHAEGDRKRRLLALNLTARGGAICTTGTPASPWGEGKQRRNRVAQRENTSQEHDEEKRNGEGGGGGKRGRSGVYWTLWISWDPTRPRLISHPES